MDGMMVERKRITDETTHIDMSHYAPGMNTLHITLDGEKSAWKIITL